MSTHIFYSAAADGFSFRSSVGHFWIYSFDMATVCCKARRNRDVSDVL